MDDRWKKTHVSYDSFMHLFACLDVTCSDGQERFVDNVHLHVVNLQKQIQKWQRRERKKNNQWSTHKTYFWQCDFYKRRSYFAMQ